MKKVILGSLGVLVVFVGILALLQVVSKGGAIEAVDGAAGDVDPPTPSAPDWAEPPTGSTAWTETGSATGRVEIEEGEFQGQVVVVDRGLATGAGRLTVTPRAELYFMSGAEEGSGTWLPLEQTLISDPHGGAPYLTGSDSDHLTIPVVDGRWGMPIPGEDYVVTAIEVEGSYARILSGQIVEAHSRHARVDVNLMGFGQLTVLDPLTGSHFENVKVLATRTERMAPGGSLVIRGLNLAVGGMSGPERKKAAGPPPSAREILSQGQSPIAIPIADYDRTLWIGRAGYQWESVPWPAHLRDTVAFLRPVGGLEIELSNIWQVRGVYDILVVRDQEAVVSWEYVRKDLTLSAEEIAEGEYRVILRHRPPDGVVTLYDVSHRVERSRLTVVSLDVAQLRKEQPKPGTLVVELVPPSIEYPAHKSLRLVISPVAGDSVGPPSFDHSLRELPFSDSLYHARLQKLPIGQYLVGVAPCGVRRLITVESGVEEVVALELGHLAIIRVWPVTERGHGVTELSLGSRLLWRRIGTSGQAEGRKAGEDSPLWSELTEFLLRPAPWTGDSWSLLAPPGKIEVLAVDGRGHGISRPTEYSVLEGPNECSLSISAAADCELHILIRGVDAPELVQLRRALLSAFEPTTGTGRLAFITMNPVDHLKETGESLLIAHFSQAGVYVTSQPRLEGMIPVAAMPARITVSAGEPASTVLEWE